MDLRLTGAQRLGVNFTDSSGDFQITVPNRRIRPEDWLNLFPRNLYVQVNPFSGIEEEVCPSGTLQVKADIQVFYDGNYALGVHIYRNGTRELFTVEG